ncbi:nucleoside phosphorylase domain-containing protein [Microdochium bolleyi]|uniref:Nucleoside phosphorylase domain-containing protein n=1 Tax=Microdochium bolleyi TaxID=196109 RepID=A0A136IK06_9PEZI|nr:nucleoside phosphorylase domain-containing protein [Microdochium bolleyi]
MTDFIARYEEGAVEIQHGGEPNDEELILGDVVVSDGIVQTDLGRRLPEQPNAESRALLAKLKVPRSRNMLQDKVVGYMDVLRREPQMAAEYPGVPHDKLFTAACRHVADGRSCDECSCDGQLVPRRRLENGSPQPAVHFGLIASGDAVIKSGEERDAVARREGVVAFEMKGAGVWDMFPCVVIKGVCDYADSHKTKAWQRYAAATAAACMKAFLDYWDRQYVPGI